MDFEDFSDTRNKGGNANQGGRNNFKEMKRKEEQIEKRNKQREEEYERQRLRALEKEKKNEDKLEMDICTVIALLSKKSMYYFGVLCSFFF